MKSAGKFGCSWGTGTNYSLKEEWAMALVDPAFYTLIAVMSFVIGVFG